MLRMLVLLLVASDPDASLVQPSAPLPAAPQRGPGPPPPVVVDPLRTPQIDPRQAALDERARALGLRRIATGYLYKGGPDERFDAIVHHDGTVEFDVDPEVVVRLEGLCLAAICVKTKRDRREPLPTKRRSLALNAAAMLIEAALTSGNTQGAPYGQSVGGPPPLPPKNPEPPPFPIGGIQGRYGYLPAPVSAMSGFMERTFELRLEMATRAARERIDLELRRLPMTLTGIWNDQARTRAERRAAVLQLWADLDDDLAAHRDDVLAKALASDLDVQRQEAARRARRTIVKFVRRMAPAGSPEAFTAAELEAFHRRPEVRTRFDPYAPEPAASPPP